MALATDQGGIQFRILNSSKGPAVRATRAQADRALYKKAIRSICENQPNLQLFQQEAADIEVEGGRRARAFAQWYAQASAPERRQACILISERFAPDPQRIRQAREAYESAVGTAEEGVAEIRLRKALYSDRTRLLQRFAVYPEGMRFLVDLRAELLPQLKGEPRLLALEAELETLFGTWFDVAFLELRRISWDSPAVSLTRRLLLSGENRTIAGAAFFLSVT